MLMPFAVHFEGWDGEADVESFDTETEALECFYNWIKRSEAYRVEILHLEHEEYETAIMFLKKVSVLNG